jgi:threonine synthase
LGAINSINWARILVQITYYFYAWLRVTDTHKSKKKAIDFVVPSGNFGNALAGYYAKRMGLGVGKIVIATNENQVLHKFFQTGVYKKLNVVQTLAPSMDISISSNLERYLYYVAHESSDSLAAWMQLFESCGELTISSSNLAEMQQEFSSSCASQEEILDTVRQKFLQDHYLLCPHTATSAVAVRKLQLPSSTTVILATAHPAKFEDALNLAISNGQLPPKPSELEELSTLPTRKLLVPAVTSEIKAHIRASLNLPCGNNHNEGGEDHTKKGILVILGIAVVCGLILCKNWKHN